MSLLILSIVPCLILYGVWRYFQIERYPRYTIGTTIRKVNTLKNGPRIEFEYSVNGNPYKAYGYKDELKEIVFPNGRYFVQFSFKNPSISKILWSAPVPASIKIAPAEGWETVPKSDQKV